MVKFQQNDVGDWACEHGEQLQQAQSKLLHAEVYVMGRDAVVTHLQQLMEKAEAELQQAQAEIEALRRRVVWVR